MSYLTRSTMRSLVFPEHELSCSWFLWRRLVRSLRERGHSATRESGAFLLGAREFGRSRITDFVLYDDLDPHCLDTGIVRFDGSHYGKLWAYVEKTSRAVIADVHVHPGEATQSDSDRRHPMIAQAGHISLILPDFVKSQASHVNARAYVFDQRDIWREISPSNTSRFFHVGLL